MPIAVVCPGCSVKLNAPDAAAGKSVKCPKCKGAIRIPAPEPEEPVVELDPVEPEPAPASNAFAFDDPAPPPPKKSGATKKPELREEPKKKPRRKDDDEEEDDDRPRRRKRDEDDEDDAPPPKKSKPAKSDSAPPMAAPVPDDGDNAFSFDGGSTPAGGGNDFAFDPDAEPEPKKPAKERPPKEESKKPRRKDDDDDEITDDPPRRGKKKDEKEKGEKGKKKIGGLIIGLIAGVAVLLLGCCIGVPIWAYSYFSDKTDEFKKELEKEGKKPPPTSSNTPETPPSGSVPAGWKELKPKDGGYRAYMPGDAIVHENGPGGGTAYEFADPAQAFEVSILAIRLRPAKAAAEAKDYRDLFTKILTSEPGSKVLSQKDITWLGATATEIVIETPGKPKKGTVVLRLVTAAGKFFVASVEAKSGRAPAAIERGFFENVELAPDIGPPPTDMTPMPMTPDPTPKPPDTTPNPPDSKLPTGWKEFKQKDGIFKVNMGPGMVTEGILGTSATYSTFSVMETTTSIKIRPSSGTVAGMAKQFTIDDIIKDLTQVRKVVGQKKETTLSGMPATEVVFENTFGAPKGKMGNYDVVRILKTDTKYYILTVSNRTPGRPAAGFETAFFDSFQLLK